MLGLCCHGDKRLVWKAIYFECLSSGKHFLEQVLVGVHNQANSSLQISVYIIQM